MTTPSTAAGDNTPDRKLHGARRMTVPAHPDHCADCAMAVVALDDAGLRSAARDAVQDCVGLDRPHKDYTGGRLRMNRRPSAKARALDRAWRRRAGCGTPMKPVTLGTWDCPTGDTGGVAIVMHGPPQGEIRLAWDTTPPPSASDEAHDLAVIRPAGLALAAEYLERPMRPTLG